MNMKTALTRIALFSLAAMLSGTAVAEGKRVVFVGCPVMRDMDLPERPCWLAQDGDKLYYLGMQADIFPPAIFFPPQLKHQVLVEAEQGEGAEICGGLPLKNMKVSVLPELDLACDTVLPKAGFAAGPEGRPSPPFRLMHIIATDPSTWPKEQPARTKPLPPFKERSFRIPFSFDDDFTHLEEAFAEASAAKYFEDVRGSKVTVSVYRDRVELTNGKILEEGPEVAQRRASLIVNNLQVWGVPQSKIATRISPQPEAGGRYVSIVVSP